MIGFGPKYFVGTKSEFTKLQLKHAVVGGDSADIGKAIEKIEKLGIEPKDVTSYVGPFNQLDAALRGFKSKYDKKHPKFIAAVEADFLQPVKKVIDAGTEWLKDVRTLPDKLDSLAEPIDDAIKALQTSPADDKSYKAAIAALAATGSLMSGIRKQGLKLNDNFDVAIIAKVVQELADTPAKIEKIAKKIEQLKAGKDYSTDLTGLIPVLQKMKGQTKKWAADVADATGK